MSDDKTEHGLDGFLRLETQEKQRVAALSRAAVPPPAEPPKKPRCGYCGTPLDDPEKQCIFCPTRVTDDEEEVAEANPFAPTASVNDAARYFGFRNKVPT
jgi:hypothetical protein